MNYYQRRMKELAAEPMRLQPDRRKYAVGTTEKPCTRCKVVLPLDAYMPMARGALGRHSICNECRRLIAKAYTRANRESRATRSRPDVCECCGEPPRRRALHYDHNHVTGAFRGWLCHGCNVALGAVGDSTDRLERLIAYLSLPNRPV
jgi:hypothetical protein